MMFLDIISILLTLGTAPDCEGYGICIAEQASDAARDVCARYENCIEAKAEVLDATLHLYIHPNRLKDQAYLRYFTKESFELRSPYPMSRELSSLLGCAYGWSLPAGKYPIEEEGGRIHIQIPLQR